jgi:hypothetical protein
VRKFPFRVFPSSGPGSPMIDRTVPGAVRRNLNLYL